MAASTSFSSSTVWAKIQAALVKPTVQKCQELEYLIASGSSKDLSSFFPAFLDNIFGLGGEPGWGLDCITKSQQPQEFEALLRFLGPDGPLLRLVYNLQIDVYLFHEFPFSNLPAPTRRLIEEGSLPLFFINKLQYQGYGQPLLALGAFEFYLFQFCYTLVSQQWQAKSLNWNNMTEIVYPRLMDEYLKYFLPLNTRSLPKFPQTSVARSPIMQQTPPSFKQSPVFGIQTRSKCRLGLLKPNLMSIQKQLTQGSPGAEKIEGDVWWSETFIQIVAEFWLNQNATDMERGMLLQNLENYMPSNNHVRLVRLLLKHIHYFANSAEPEHMNSHYHEPIVSPLEEFKRSILPTFLQKKIYMFLKHGFVRWPLDSSFRIMLETWLTYIQPWRYTIVNKEQKEAGMVDDYWYPFIRDNFLIITVIFQQFLQRTKSMMFTSQSNTYMVFRVSKVFSLTNFSQLLRAVERKMCGEEHKSTLILGGSCIASEINTMLRMQISELEQTNFVYINMFGRETENEVQFLLKQLTDTIRFLKAPKPADKTNKSRLASFFDISSYFASSATAFGDLSVADVSRLLTHLEQAALNFCNVFSIKPMDISMTSNLSESEIMPELDQSALFNTMITPSVPHTPDCYYSRQHGLQLTKDGRYQLMNGLRKFDLTFQGDPELQPIRSFENKALVRFLYRISSFINEKFQKEIEMLYSKQGIIGKISKVYFAPPLSPSKVPSSPMKTDQIEDLERPRVTLRFLASYQTIVFLALLYIVLRFSFEIGPFGYCLVLVVCWLLYGLCRAVTLTDDFKTE